MHLLSAKPGGFTDEEGIIDLAQTPAQIVILSTQDTSLGLLAETADSLPETCPSIRLANLANLLKPAAYDLYEHRVLQHARLIVVSLLGGKSYWPYGIERLTALAAERELTLVLVPGDDQPDAQLSQSSTVADTCSHRIWQYLRHGGSRNAWHLFLYLEQLLLNPAWPAETGWQEPRAHAPCVLYSSDANDRTLSQWLAARDVRKPSVLLLFYRSHLQSGNTAAFDALIDLLAERFNVLALATLSLKDPGCLETVNHALQAAGCQVIINTTSFSQHVEGNAALSSAPQLQRTGLFCAEVPVIQAILAASDEADWQASAQGLRARDVAMNVALPEFDGRIISRAISFKESVRRSERTETDIIRYRLHAERAGFVGELACRWATLVTTANRDKRLALVLSNYPTRDGRIGNGVGLDTPASTVTLLAALQAQGFDIDRVPDTGDALVSELLRGVTNDLDRISLKPAHQSLALEDYTRHFEALPAACRKAVSDRWGSPSTDPKCRHDRLIVSGIRLGNVFVGIQPARGFDVDLVANYHDPDLVPPHGYLAFHFWLRHHWRADAVVHIGKHGNLEWLPGKSIGLSDHCWPDIALGPLPHLYPFIVNDPGEGAQAKRRAQAVIIDHLMPPLARADSYGPMQELELLVDEYYQALGLDPRREAHLRARIIALLKHSHLLEELSLADRDDEQAMLDGVDTYLCDLKEAQIRHGLHRLGQTPSAERMPETLCALLRVPRGEAEADRGILHCLSEDLGLIDYDPLSSDSARPWQGPTPPPLQAVDHAPWRHCGDTRERLELLATRVMAMLFAAHSRAVTQETHTGGTPEADSDDTRRALSTAGPTPASNTLANPAHIDNQYPDLHLDGLPPVNIADRLPCTHRLLQHVEQQLLPAITASGRNEIDNLIGALEGRFVPAGPSGAPSRGRLDVLPTGRNFYSLDARSIPTRTAWELGQQSAELIVQRHVQEQGDYPRQIGISVWGHLDHAHRRR